MKTVFHTMLDDQHELFIRILGIQEDDIGLDITMEINTQTFTIWYSKVNQFWAVPGGYSWAEVTESLGFGKQLPPFDNYIRDILNEVASHVKTSMIKCPFCDGKPKIMIHYDAPTRDMFYINCIDCRVKSRLFDTVEETISFWNSRNT